MNRTPGKALDKALDRAFAKPPEDGTGVDAIASNAT
jgi:hypothetical protein